MSSKYTRIARKEWIQALNSRYGVVLHEHSSYEDVANSISFFTNQIYRGSQEGGAIKKFIYLSNMALKRGAVVFTGSRLDE